MVSSEKYDIVIVAETLNGIYKDSFKAKELVKNRKIKRPDYISRWWYLHGDLEDEVGYDKGIIVSQSHLKGIKSVCDGEERTVYYLPDGIYDVKIIDIDKPCKGYFYTEFKHYDNVKGITPFMRGLVVFKDDKKANEYALEKYKSKSKIL